MFTSMSTIIFTILFAMTFTVSIPFVLCVVIAQKVSVWVEVALDMVLMTLAQTAETTIAPANGSFNTTINTHPGHGTPEPATLSSLKAEDNDPPTPSLTSDSHSHSSVLSCNSSSSTRSILRKMDSVYKKKTVVFAEERNTVRAMPNRDDPVIQAQFKDIELPAQPRVKKSKSADVKKSSSSAQVPSFASAAARLQWMMLENNKQACLKRINDPRSSRAEKLGLAASLERLTQQQSTLAAPAPAPKLVEKEQKKEKSPKEPSERRRAVKTHVLAVLARVNAPPPPPPLSPSTSSDSDSDSDSYFDADDDKVKELETPVLVRSSSPKVAITIRAKSIITSPIIPTSPIMAQEDIVKPFVSSHSALKRFEYSPRIVSPTMEMSMLEMDAGMHFRSPYGDAYELFEDPRIVRQY